MTDAPDTPEEGENHIAPPAVELDAAHAIAAGNAALGFPTPPAVQAVLDAAAAAAKQARRSPAPPSKPPSGEQ